MVHDLMLTGNDNRCSGDSAQHTGKHSCCYRYADRTCLRHAAGLLECMVNVMRNTARLILLKVDSISVCFSVAGIMDYHSVLAYSLINIKVVFLKRLKLNSSIFGVFFTCA